MVSFSNMNSEKNAVGRPQHQNVSLVYGETLTETVFMVRRSCVSDHLLFRRGSTRTDWCTPQFDCYQYVYLLGGGDDMYYQDFLFVCSFVNLFDKKVDVQVTFNYMQLAFLCVPFDFQKIMHL